MLTRLLATVLALALCPLSIAATLKVGLSSDMPPLVYHDEGQLAGIEVANAQVLGQYLGYKIQYVEKPRGQLEQALQKGEVDILMSGLLNSDKLLASQPFMPAPVQAVIRFDDAGLRAYKGVLFQPSNRIGIIEYSAGSAFAKQYLQQAQISHFSSAAQALSALKNKQVDYVLLTEPEARWLERDNRYSDLLRVEHSLTDDNLHWLMAGNNTSLQQQVNRALAQMQQTGTLRAIINQWLPVSADSDH